MKAIWNGKVIAESENTIRLEGNYYFPSNALNGEYIKSSNTLTVCPWKGEASYYSIEVDGKLNEDAAWYYPQPKDAAKEIANHVAFWRGVKITK